MGRRLLGWLFPPPEGSDNNISCKALQDLAQDRSCNDDDDTDWSQVLPNALVTVKQNGDACYLQLDDNTTLLAQNLKSTVFGGKEVRALVNYSSTNEKSDLYNQVVHVNWIDSILTKKPVPSLASDTENSEKYGNNIVDIVRDWVTVAEDGYLTLRFRALWAFAESIRNSSLWLRNPLQVAITR